MKNRWIWLGALILLPLAAIGLGGMPDAVEILYPESGEAMSCLPVYCSYFTYVTDVPVSLCLPAAVLFSCLSFALAVAYSVSKKRYCLKGTLATAFISMSLAVLPILIKTEYFVLPNVGFPILMGLECLLACYLMKKPAQGIAEKAQGPRLGQ